MSARHKHNLGLGRDSEVLIYPCHRRLPIKSNLAENSPFYLDRVSAVSYFIAFPHLTPPLGFPPLSAPAAAMPHHSSGSSEPRPAGLVSNPQQLGMMFAIGNNTRALGAANARMGITGPCAEHYKAFEECLTSGNESLQKCRHYLGVLSRCLWGTGAHP
ncbi:hypothetical protein EJB05_44903, partial [Eragrostis curvula]